MSRLQKSLLGTILPCFIACCAEALLVLCASAAFQLVGKLNGPLYWFGMFVLLGAILGFVPATSFVMGVVNVYCCPPKQFPLAAYLKLKWACILSFYCLQVPLLFFSPALGISFLLFPVVVAWFQIGQATGIAWVQDHTLETFFGLKNGWEKPE